MEETAKVSEKGQIVIPKKVRDKIGLDTGDELIVNLVDQKIMLRKKPKSFTDYMWNLHSDVWRCARDEKLAEAAAEIRVRGGLRTPDALQIATYLVEEASASITNDERLRKIEDLRIIIMNDYV